MKLREQQESWIDLKKKQLDQIAKDKGSITQQINYLSKKNEKLLLQKSKMEDNKNVKMKIANFI